MPKKKKGFGFWCIRRKRENDIIGFAINGSYFPGYPNDVGFNIGLDYVDMGYATETLNELTRFVGSLGYKETFGHCYENNFQPSKPCKNVDMFIREELAKFILEIMLLN